MYCLLDVRRVPGVRALLGDERGILPSSRLPPAVVRFWQTVVYKMLRFLFLCFTALRVGTEPLGVTFLDAFFLSRLSGEISQEHFI